MKTRKVLGCAGAIIAIAVTGLAGLFLLNAFNPMATFFLTSIEISNGSGVDLKVTPIGIYEGNGKYGPLPRFLNEDPPNIPLPRAHNLALKSNQTIKFTYDWDDVNFRHILVRAPSGEVLILDTDRAGTLHSCHPPSKDKYEIPSLSELRKAPQELIPCARGKVVEYADAVEY